MFTLLRLIFLPAKIGVGTTKLGVKTGYRIGRTVGVRRVLFLSIGIGIGLLIAPETGAETRAKLRRLLDERRPVGDHDLAEKVRFELAHSPRTWHLPQPMVDVTGNVAVLRGTVPHEAGRLDLERTAASVAGVLEVDNQISVAGPGTS